MTRLLLLAISLVFFVSLFTSTNAPARRAQSVPTTVPPGDVIDRSAFSAPPMDVSPAVRWWWPGGDVDDTELAREMTAMQNAGFGAAEIQSFAVGLPSDALSAVHTYGTPGWFDHLAAAANQAESLGFKLDLTLGSAWPSGGDWVSGAQSLQQLVLTSSTVTGPGLLEIPFPVPTTPQSYYIASKLLQIRNKFDISQLTPIASLAVRLAFDQTDEYPSVSSTVSGYPALPATTYLDPTSVVDLSKYTTSVSRHIVWPIPSGTWMIFAVYSGPTGSMAFYSADPNGGLVLDHFNASAVQGVLSNVAGMAASKLGSQFGSTLRSIFFDSFELRSELFWTSDFLTEFQARRGYQLQPFLPILFRPYRDDTYLRTIYPDAPPTYEMRDVGVRVRQDYDQTVSELMIERFFNTVASWGAANGVITRGQAHGAPVDLLNAYGAVSIPETETLYASGTPAFLKMAASAAHAQGKNLVSSEIFSFRGFDGTPPTMLQEANKQFAAGVNHLVYHGFPYLYADGFTYKNGSVSLGWMPFNSPYLPGIGSFGTFGTFLNDRSPYWPYLSTFNRQIARTQLVLRMGHPVNNIALYIDQLGYPANATSDPVVNHQLELSGQNYDYVNAALLQTATFSNGQLHVGSNSYYALVLDTVAQMSNKTAEVISQLSNQGLPIVFVSDVPHQSTGYLNSSQNDTEVQSIFTAILGRTRDVVAQQPKVVQGNAVFISDPATLPTTLAGDLQIDPDLILSDDREDIHFAHRQTPSADYYFLTSSRSLPFDTVVSFHNNGRYPTLFNVATGDIVTAPLYSVQGSRTVVPIHLDPGGAVVVGFEATSVPEPPYLSAADIQFVERQADGSITGGTLSPGTYSVTTSTGTTSVTITGASLSNIVIPTWNLVTSSPDGQGETNTQSFPGIPPGDLSTVPQLKGFEGTATYTAAVNVDQSYLQDDVHPVLSLGQVYNVAIVKINRRYVTTLFASPFQVDVLDYLTPGANQIEIDVVASGSPAGLLGPVVIAPSYQMNLTAAQQVTVSPVPLSVVVTPVNFPNSTVQDMINSIDEAAKITNHVNFQWYWQNPTSATNPNGGPTVECDQVAVWVKEARRLNLGVTLQFQTFITAVNSNGSGTVEIATPVEPLSTASFGHSALAQAYVKEVACLAGLEPDYLVLGPEVNFVVSFNYPEFQNFQQVYLKAYDTVKSISPWTQVGLSWQYDGLRNSYPADSWAYIGAAGPQDFVGLTTYYGYSDQRFIQYSTVGSIPADYYRPIRERLGSNVPILFTEVGYSSAYPNGLSNQSDFVVRLPELLQGVAPTSVAWALLHDVNYFVGAGAALNQSGLLNSDDTPKPAWNTVLSMRSSGRLTNIVPQVVNPAPMPFAVTAVPAHFPTSFTTQDGFNAIAEAAQVSGHISMQFAWKDSVTGQVWDCSSIKQYTDEATRRGLTFTIQLNTYATLPATVSGQNPIVQLLSPVIPSGAAGQPLSMAMPEVQQAFVQEITCLAGLHPQYIVLGPELNFLLGSTSPQEYFAFAQAFQQAYKSAKAVSPSTQIGASFQYDAIRQSLLQKSTPWYITQLGTQDFLGLTTYFSYTQDNANTYPSVADVPRDYYDPIHTLAGNTPIVFTEAGWSSYFSGGSDNEVAYLNRLSTLMANVKPALVIWAMLHDTINYFRGDIQALNYLGLRKSDDTTKSAWDGAVRLKNKGLHVNPVTVQAEPACRQPDEILRAGRPNVAPIANRIKTCRAQ